MPAAAASWRHQARPTVLRSTSSPRVCTPWPPSSPTSATDLRALAEHLDEDPERLAEIRERRQLLRDLRRKYGDSLADVIELPERGAGTPGGARELRERVAALEQERSLARTSHERRAARTSARRASGRIEARLRRCSDVVRSLAMPHAEMDVTVGGEAPGDDVTFLIAANPGLAVAAIVAGGQRWRTGPHHAGPATGADRGAETLVFDEVDAGIGGTAATAVGRVARPARAAPSGAVRHPPRPGRRTCRHPDHGDEDGRRGSGVSDDDGHCPDRRR